MKAGMAPEQVAKFMDAVSSQLVPMKRAGTSSEIAKAILFMAADATYCTGANLVADGGIILHSPAPKFD